MQVESSVFDTGLAVNHLNLPLMVFPVCRYQMGDFSGDVLREVSVPLVEKPANGVGVSLTNGIRHKTDVRIKVLTLYTTLSVVSLFLLQKQGNDSDL